jgi:hypothetical protein
MDYYQGVVVEYLRADRSLFVNTECCIQLNRNPNPDLSGPHWYCDALAINLRDKEVLLCEISYAKGLSALFKRLKEWEVHWKSVRLALERDCNIDPTYKVRPWIFAPSDLLNKYESQFMALKFDDNECRTTKLEDVQPWKYCSWDRTIELDLQTPL